MPQNSSSKIRGKIRLSALHKKIAQWQEWPEVYAIFPADELQPNGSFSRGSVTLVHIKEHGIRLRIHDSAFSQDVLLASNDPKALETKVKDYLSRSS